MDKKGQITIFVLIGLLLLLGVSTYFLVATDTGANLFKPTIPEEKAIVTSVQTCLKGSMQKAIQPFFRNGFYYELPSSAITYAYLEELDSLSVPTRKIEVQAPYFKKETVQTPTTEVFENNYALYVRDYFNDCIQGVTFTGAQVSFKTPKVKSHIKKEGIFVDLDFEVTITTQETTKKIRSYNEELDYDMRSKYEFVKTYVDNEIPEFYSIENMSSQAYETNFTFDIIRVSDSDFAYRLDFKDYEEEYDELLTLNFVVRY